MLGGQGRDKILGGGVLNGGAGPDYVNSYSYEREVAVDTLRGAAGDDKLEGAGSDDVLSGGSGDDNLDGGRGRDRLDGGPQRDRCNVDGSDPPPRNCEDVR